MDPKATVQALMYAIQKGDFEKAKSHISDDFQFSGYAPKPIDAKTWLEMSSSLKKAFPNIEYHFRVESVQSGGIVKISSEIKGTQQEELDLTGLNMGRIPSTNKSFVTGREHSKLTLHGEKISSWVVVPGKDTGLMVILHQLGANPLVQ
jgi:hypothetical protein